MAYKGRNVLYGFLVWLIPSAVHFAASFVVKPGYYAGAAWYWERVVVVGVATFFLARYFAHVSRDHVREAIVVGATWFLIGALIEAALVVPVLRLEPSMRDLPWWQIQPVVLAYRDYFVTTVPLKIIFPIMATGFGWALAKRREVEAVGA